MGFELFVILPATAGIADIIPLSFILSGKAVLEELISFTLYLVKSVIGFLIDIGKDEIYFAEALVEDTSVGVILGGYRYPALLGDTLKRNMPLDIYRHTEST
jgi:hypothetical protein